MTDKQKNLLQLMLLLAVFVTGIAYLSQKVIEEQQAIDRMDKEADAYFESLSTKDSLR